MLTEHDSSRSDSRNTRPFELALCLVLSSIAFLRFALATKANSWFYGDDYLAFRLLADMPFAEYLTAPVDVHFIPLHRLIVGLSQILFPFNFDVPLLVMSAFHLGGIWLLYRCLQLIRDSPLNAPLACLLGTNFYAAACLPYWTAGIARFAYILFSTAAIHQYLKFRMEGGLWRGAAVVLCLVCATAFFSKGLLIPGFLVALELVLVTGRPWHGLASRFALLLAATLAAVIYFFVGLSYGTGKLPTPPLDWEMQRLAFEIVAVKFPQSFLGLLPPNPLSLGNWMVVVLWAALFVTSSKKATFNLAVWAVGLCVVFVNFAAITFSPRMQLGSTIVSHDRYYFENFYLVALFLAVIARRVELDVWLTKARHARFAVIGAWGIVCLLAVQSQQTYLQALASPVYATFPLARTYGLNLLGGIADLRREHDGTLHFAENGVPRAALGYVNAQIGIYSKFLPIFDSGIQVSTTGPCRHVVRVDGSIQPPPGNCP